MEASKASSAHDEAIRAEVLKRRSQLKRAAGIEPDFVPPGSEKIWGLALSGGGVRSATFCLGLLRALAQRNILLRFDLLSTVSGGGYIGAMLGRLFDRARSPDDVTRIQQRLGTSEVRWFLWWLRANGRYLIPHGAKDTAFAAALYLRNFLGVHFELGLIALALGLALAAFDLAVWGVASQLGFWEGYLAFNLGAARFLCAWLPTAWLLFVIPALWGAVQIAAFWDIAWFSRATLLKKVVLLLGGLSFALAYFFIPMLFFQDRTAVFGNQLRLALWAIVVGLTVIWLLGVLWASCTYRKKKSDNGESPEDVSRNKLTVGLSRTFLLALGILGAGLVDRAAWFLAFEQMNMVASGLTLFVAAAVLRVLLPFVGKMTPGQTGVGVVLLLGRMAGYALTLLLCVWWVSLAHKAVLGGLFQLEGIDFRYGWVTLLLLAIPVLGYLALTGYNISFLNLSSLHGFYRARLARSYLGAANAERFSTPGSTTGDTLGALDAVPPQLSAAVARHSVADVVEGDDARFEEYLPQRWGGPIHFINLCINESKDPRGGQFNQDRRGRLMTVVSGGQWRVSLERWMNLTAPSPLTLASWTAISGAVFAPGLGSMTRGGISALATFAGIRTGYWWDKATRTGTGTGTQSWSLNFEKSAGILQETFGAFRAGDKDNWFLSDGGHFENTGAYALMAQRAEVIVVADCGADPDYRFDDLENLVRKARIDLHAEVLFQRPWCGFQRSWTPVSG